MCKRMTKRQRLWRLKRFILHFLEASDFNISDIAIHKDEVSITPEMELVIKKTSGMPEKAKEEILKKALCIRTKCSLCIIPVTGIKNLTRNWSREGPRDTWGLLRFFMTCWFTEASLFLNGSI